jgi:hypothetical protein
MSDTFGNDAAHSEWRQLCQAAFLELDPTKLLERTAAARSAVLDRFKANFSKPDNSEQYALRPKTKLLVDGGDPEEPFELRA